MVKRDFDIVLVTVWSHQRILADGMSSTATAGTSTSLTSASTLPVSSLFNNDHDRDNYIMKLSSDILDLKTMLTSLFDKFNHLPTNPSGTGGSVSSSFVAFMARISNRLSGLGINQIIHFDEVIVNKGNGFDSRLGVFRCPLAGTYEFSLTIGSYGGIQLEIVNNGKAIGKAFTSRSRFGRDVEEEAEVEGMDDDGIAKRMLDPTLPSSPTVMMGASVPANGQGYVQPGSEATPGSARAIVDLKVGDEVWVRHSTDNPHDILFANGMTTFSGNLLSPSKK